LSISTSNVPAAECGKFNHKGMPAADYVLVEVSDTGTGIPQDIIDKIFEPFFSTKEVGKGTGLGLSTVHAIVKSHGGFVSVYSEPGRGTTFKVYLPADPALRGGPPPAEVVELPRGRGELVLVVDDESPIRDITQRTLEAFGYHVLTAADGAEAVAVYAQHRERIALVLTDMLMPVMDGPALIMALTRMNPAIRIVAASGLNANDNLAKIANAGVKDFLPKPYAAETMLKLFREVLDRPPSGKGP
jgi:CheY-like chemotaxis protein